MFKCEDVLGELSAYLDDELTVDIRKQIETHMEHCRTCRAVYDSTRKTLRIVTDSGSFELSREVSDRVANGIRAKIRAKQSGASDTSGS
jgi:predicted anti-sigma-YlaC factor YlaD